MNEILTEGVWTNQMLADFFRVKLKTFRDSRKKKLEELKDYADFEEGRGFITITKVKNRTPYTRKQSKNKRIVKEEFPKCWRRYDTCVRCGTEIYEKRRNDLTATLNTIQAYTRDERMLHYGSPGHKDTSIKGGDYGRCDQTYCKIVYIQGEEWYYPLSEEEEQKLDEIFKEVFITDSAIDQIKQQALYWDAYDEGDMGTDELIESLQQVRKKNSFFLWKIVMLKMQQKYGIEIKRITESEQDALSIGTTKILPLQENP